jgi:hypothetical protein
MKISAKQTAVLFSVLLALDIAGRLTPHAPNFTPLAATALFASFLFESTVAAALVPLLALGITDGFLGATDWRIMAAVYLSLALPALFGRRLKAELAVRRILPAALSSSVIFFTVTNFAVWRFAGSYAPDLNGLAQCYLAALPFLKNTLAGDLVWSTVLFGAYAIVRMPVTGMRLPICGLTVARD